MEITPVRQHKIKSSSADQEYLQSNSSAWQLMSFKAHSAGRMAIDDSQLFCTVQWIHCCSVLRTFEETVSKELHLVTSISLEPGHTATGFTVKNGRIQIVDEKGDAVAPVHTNRILYTERPKGPKVRTMVTLR
ncbi:hypothetical protein [Rugamonas apoptosis]|uniref:Uncharacterized protein n=1 Tax=Rugamonas apoptosis TaxID=2758570 RepID=A0A7W2ING9_9BURK|nr:hypothetical protein [Rugamonas apoptosis]MBA5690738.1 hypothetical protein [Rugamonas apoptosis]